MLTQERLKEHLSYNCDTGLLTWINDKRAKVKIGDTAGCISVSGYRVIKLFGNKYYAHRLVWLYVHGALPDEFIDHINGDRADNRIVNLRAANKKINARNQKIRNTNKSGVMGVHRHGQKLAWRVCIRNGEKHAQASFFDSKFGNKDNSLSHAKEFAELCYQVLGYHSNHGQR